MVRKKLKGRTAWLVTRHWIAKYPKEEVAAIFSGRLGGVRVKEFVELLSFTNDYTLGEQAAIQWSGYGQAPYPVQFGQTTTGDPSACEVICGNDPYLRARIVDNLIVVRNANGTEVPTWKERPRSQAGQRKTRTEG